MDSLGRYYTKDPFSELLIQNLEQRKPKVILDLGSGGGSLLKAAYNRWQSAKFIAADIDLHSISKLNDELPFIKVFRANGLRVNIEKSISLKKSSIDVAVCNPPYLLVKEKKKFENLFIETKLSKCLKLNKVTSDIIFLAQNIKLLRNDGELGIILPDSILTGQGFQLFREALLENHRVKSLIELPERIFPKTEAKTHIVLIEKGTSSGARIPMLISNKIGQCIDKIEVNASSLVERMDFSYHKMKSQYAKSKPLKKLSDYDFELIRGNRTNQELQRQKRAYLHSTSFNNKQHLFIKSKSLTRKVNSSVAKPGDIVIVRVGRGCVGKAALIRTGAIQVSDCVYIVRAKSPVIEGLWRFINSDKSKDWFQANSHGVCAKVLNRNDIGNIPVLTL